jgi:hypothetical protein
MSLACLLLLMVWCRRVSPPIQPRLGFDANMAKMLRFNTNYEQHMPTIISDSVKVGGWVEVLSRNHSGGECAAGSRWPTIVAGCRSAAAQLRHPRRVEALR